MSIKHVKYEGAVQNYAKRKATQYSETSKMVHYSNSPSEHKNYLQEGDHASNNIYDLSNFLKKKQTFERDPLDEELNDRSDSNFHNLDFKGKIYFMFNE